MLTTFLMPLVLLARVERPEAPGEELRVLQPVPRDRHDRRLRRAEPVPVLRVLGSDAGPDVLHHRDLGRAAARLRGREVLPVHDGRLAADAGRDPGALLAAPAAVRRRELRPGARTRRTRRRRCSTPMRAARGRGRVVEDAAVALRGVRAGLRHQGADGAVPHLAARRAHRSADGGLGGARRRAAQDGHLRLRALRAAALPGRRRAGRAADLRARAGRHPLRRAGRDGADATSRSSSPTRRSHIWAS